LNVWRRRVRLARMICITVEGALSSTATSAAHASENETLREPTGALHTHTNARTHTRTHMKNTHTHIHSTAHIHTH